jgi:hypothetical protein
MKDEFIYVGSWTLTFITMQTSINDLLSLATAFGSLAVSFTGIYVNLKRLKNEKKQNENTI